MNAISFSIITSCLLALAAPVNAATADCPAGYKTFLGKISPYIERVDDADLPTLMRRGLSIYDACQAGDTFSPHGIWDQIAADMAKKSKK